MKKIIILLLLLIIPSLSWAHDEYAWIMKNDLRNPETNQGCCGEEDCFKVQVSQFRKVGDYYEILLLDEKVPENLRGKMVKFPVRQTLLSKDRFNWVCVGLYDEEPRCFFVNNSG